MNNMELAEMNKMVAEMNARDNSKASEYNVGASNYSEMDISPWDIMESMGILKEYLMGDIIKRVMRAKDGEDKSLDWEKIEHLAKKLKEIENK